MLKRLLIISAIVIAVVLIGLKFVLSSYVNKNFLVAEIEKSINGRVELGSIDIALLRPTAKLTLHNVRVAKKDAHVTDKVPHDDRPVLTASDVMLKKAYVEVSWRNLLSKKVVVKSILIDELEAQMVLYKNGKNSLETLFIKPIAKRKNSQPGEGSTPLKQQKKASPKVKNQPVVKVTKALKAEERQEESKEGKEASIFAATLEAFEIKNAKLDVDLESASLKLVAGNMNLKLIEGMDFEFSELTKLTPTKFKTDGSFQLYSRDKKVHYGKVDLAGDVVGEFIDKRSGVFKPIVELELELVEGSYLKHVPVLDKLTSRFVNITKIPGLDKIVKKNWDQNYQFGKGQTLKVQLNDTTYKLLEPLKVEFGGWQVRLEKGAWVRSTDTLHAFNYQIIADKSASKLIKNTFEKVQKLVPKKYREKTVVELDHLFSPEGLFSLSFETRGKLTNPKVKELSKIPELGNLKNQLKNTLKQKLQKELDNGAEEKLKSKVSDFFKKL